MNDVVITVVACIAWPVWVMVLTQIFKRSMAADAVATMLGLLVIIVAVQR